MDFSATKELQKNNYKRPKIKDFEDKALRSKSQTKDFKRRRHLSGLYSNSNSSKIVYAWNAAEKVILLKTIKKVNRTMQ